MAYSKQSVVSDGTLSTLLLTIPFLNRDDVHVYINADEAPVGRWNWVGKTERSIVFDPVVPAGLTVTVVRVTTTDELYHSFSGGAQFTSRTLDEALTQTLFVAQEFKDISAVPSDTAPRPVGPVSLPGFSNQFSRSDHTHSISELSGVAITTVTYRLSADGVLKTFHMPGVPLNDNALSVYISGVYQSKLSYTRAGANVTFTEAPPVGTDVIEVVFTGTEGDLANGATGTVTITVRNGDGVTTKFYMSTVPTPGSVLDVYIHGIRQQSTTYTQTDTEINFTEAPPAGTSNVEFVVTGPAV